jgi:predicted DNA binding protein
MPFFWVWGDSPEAFMEQAEGEPNMAAVDLLGLVKGGALFRAEWTPDAGLIQGIKELNATIIEATGTANNWRFEVRTEKQNAFRNFQNIFEDHGISVELERLYDLEELAESDTLSVTSEQRETLLTAYRDGYFEKPRETTQEELSEHFDISSREVSDRLRRGTRNLIAASLVPSGKP